MEGTLGESSQGKKRKKTSVILHEDIVVSEDTQNKTRRLEETIVLQYSILEERKKKIEELLNMLNSKDQEIQDKNLQLEALRFKDECLFDQVKRLKNVEAENAALKVASAAQLSEISRLKSIGDEYRKKFLDLKRNEELEIEEGELSVKEIQKSQEKNIKALKEKLINVSNLCKELKEKNDKLVERISCKNKQVESLSEENNRLKSDNIDQLLKISSLEKKNSDQRDELKKVICELEYKINTLNNIVNNRYDEIKDLYNIVSYRDDKINDLSTFNNRLRSKCDILRKEHEELKNENQTLLKDLSKEVILNEFYENEKKLESDEESAIRANRIFTCVSVVECLLTDVEKSVGNRL